MKDETMQALWM